MRVVSVGEILWDLIGDKEFLGGAPFNLCAHLARLGHDAIFISAVGDDERGRRALTQARKLGIDVRFISRTGAAKTGVSEVLLDEGGKATHRIPRPAAYDFVTLSDGEWGELKALHPDWICYGTLAQMETGPRALICRLCCENPAVKRFYDINLRPRCWTPELVEDLMTQANSVKLNDEETTALARLFDWPVEPLEQFCGAAAERFSLELICITRGADGCALWREGQYVESPGFPVEVSDTVGAGDAFSAALLHGLHQKWSLRETADFANRVGALVASRAGATPVWSETEARNLKRH
ncbi:MAG: carbohydrate kinase [Bryobacteraceae bacterium]